MSEFKVPLTTILDLRDCPNSDSLSIATIYGFEVVTKRGLYNSGDKVLYIPIDSILPHSVEVKLFGADSKIKLNNSRVRQIRIRGQTSQGMICKPEDIGVSSFGTPESDYSEQLGITKYEPPVRGNGPGTVAKRDKPLENKYFHKYGGISNLKWYPELFAEDEIVSITEKLHGSNTRAGLVPSVANTWWKKGLKLIGLLPSHEWCYGSNNVQLQERNRFGQWNGGYYGKDIYGAVLEKYDVKSKLRPGEVIYGEIIGAGIQENYTYGCKDNEHKLVLFDLKIQTETSSEYADVDTFQAFCKERGFEMCPELYRGTYNRDLAKSLTKGNSVYCPTQKVREGVVLKPLKETDSHAGRKLLKLISEDYLNDQSNTDYH
jgi:RNA ligase (TIGR02306 family)